MSSPPDIVVTRDGLAALAERAGRARRVALDLEANGRFAYRARVSTLQLAWDGGVAVVDPLAPGLAGDLAPLAQLLSSGGPVKVVHDVGYDARLLTEAGISLGNVHDTALLAAWLGRPATGLASVAESELGVTLDKSLQAQDWGARPLTERSLAYLAADVVHLLAIDDRLWTEAEAAGIHEEVSLETDHRLRTAARSVREPDPRPAFTRVKGADALAPVERAILRRLMMAREAAAERLDTPAGELVPSGVLLAVARARPASMRDLAKIRAQVARLDSPRVAEALLEAVVLGLSDGELSAEDRAWLEPRRLPPAVLKARRDREGRLSAWRKSEAKARGVNPQVVVPGHCAADILGKEPVDVGALREIEGFGEGRVARYGSAILAALREPTPP